MNKNAFECVRMHSNDLNAFKRDPTGLNGIEPVRTQLKLIFLLRFLIPGYVQSLILPAPTPLKYSHKKNKKSMFLQNIFYFDDYSFVYFIIKINKFIHKIEKPSFTLSSNQMLIPSIEQIVEAWPTSVKAWPKAVGT